MLSVSPLFAPIDAPCALLFPSLSTSSFPPFPPSLSLSSHESGNEKKSPAPTDQPTLQPFTAASAAFWCLLSAATVVDYVKTKQLSAVARGASVRRGIRWVVALYALDSVLLLILSLASDSTTFSDVVDFVSLILEDFAEAAFLLLLLAVAAGAGIARPGLGPHRSKVIFVPLVYLVTTLAVDLAEVRNKWRRGREREREEEEFVFFLARLCRTRTKKRKTSNR